MCAANPYTFQFVEGITNKTTMVANSLVDKAILQKIPQTLSVFIFNE
jgi:hypothetical protein